MPHHSKESPQQHPLLQKGKRSMLQIIFGRSTLIVLALMLNFFLFFSFLLGLFENLPAFFGSTLVFTGVMLIFVLNTRDNPSVKLSWCILIALLPLFGSLLYLFVRTDLGQRLNRRMIRESVRESLPHIPEQEALYRRIKEEDPDFYNLAQYLKTCAHAPVYGNTQVQYFPLGELKFQEMLVQLETAEKFIFLEYFTIAEGFLWEQLLAVLERKAKEGVEVRVLYDGTNAIYNLPYNYPKRLEAMGIQCRMFARIRPFVSTHYNNRDHRKICVIDGRTAFTGGINLEDRYINRETVYGHWKDTAVMVQGEAARGFTLLFLQMWNAASRERTYGPYLTPSAPVPDATGYVIPYGTGPTDRERVGEMVYLHILNQARDYVYIMTPYLILDSETVTALRFAAQRGVDVRLVLPHIPDKKYAFALARAHYRELLEAGVKIYEYTPGFVHGKVFLSDDRCAVVGTVNLDYRSLYLHHECAAYLYRVPALADIKADFRDTFGKSHPVTLAEAEARPLLSRFAAALLKVLAPLM